MHFRQIAIDAIYGAVGLATATTLYFEGRITVDARAEARAEKAEARAEARWEKTDAALKDSACCLCDRSLAGRKSGLEGRSKFPVEHL